MKRIRLLKLGGAVIMISSLFLVSCVNSDYDISKDIDATMGLGSSGLALKFGNTEKVYLRDLLKVSNSNMLDTTSTSLYFLVKDGVINTNTTINNADPVMINPVSVKSRQTEVEETGTYPPNKVFTINESNTSSTLDINIKNIDAAVKEVSTVIPDKLEVTGSFPSSLAGTKITTQGVVITFPDFIYSDQLNSKHQYQLENGKTSFSLDIDSIVFPKTGKFGQVPINNALSLSDDISMTGAFNCTTTQQLYLKQGDPIYSELTFVFSPMQVKTVSGVMNKEVSPEIDPIQISNDLPDFLQDESVKLEVSNPTLKLWTKNGEQWPFALLFGGTMKSVKNNSVITSVNIPTSGSVEIPQKKDQIYYFSQTETPFDTAAISAAAEKYKVPTFGKLVEKLPDNIQIDMKNGKVSMNQNMLQTANLGQTYSFNMGYRMLIPLSFDANTTIVYTDSIDDLHEDLKKYETSGLKLTAEVFNAVPLDLNVQVIPYDYNGKSLASEITFTTEVAKGATPSGAVTTPISCVLTAANPASIKKLDKLLLKISSTSTSSNSLMSNQYIQLNNIRLILTSPIIGNFN
ncbi:MAG: hypothetical protein PHU66_08240 [Bacteroidaceae bacterium]|nr:hypothetical protein [Bacteroidaceae bacterium]